MGECMYSFKHSKLPHRAPRSRMRGDLTPPPTPPPCLVPYRGGVFSSTAFCHWIVWTRRWVLQPVWTRCQIQIHLSLSGDENRSSIVQCCHPVTIILPTTHKDQQISGRRTYASLHIHLLLHLVSQINNWRLQLV